MINHNDEIILWDDGKVRFCAVAPFSILNFHVGFSYENLLFKGYDNFALSPAMMRKISQIYESLNGSVHLEDVDCETDGYIDILSTGGILKVSGQLGSSFSNNSLKFEFESDQSLLAALLNCLNE